MKIARLSRLWLLKDGKQGWYLLIGKYAVRFFEELENAKQHLRVLNREAKTVIQRRLRKAKKP